MPKWGYNFPPLTAAVTAICLRPHSAESTLPGHVIYIFAYFLMDFYINALEGSVISALEAVGELVCICA